MQQPATVISVQSHVSSGHVGNAAAVYPLRRLGHEVCPVHTALLAHHPGHGAFRGDLVAPETVRAVLDGLGEHGMFAATKALLSGYMGSPQTGLAVADAWEAVSRASPDALYCCMPVMGDAREGLYVAPEMTEMFRQVLVPRAGAVIANAFEAGVLAGVDVAGAESAATAAQSIRESGADLVIVTSVPTGDGEIGNLLVDGEDALLFRVAEREIAAKGTGDFLGAVWLGLQLHLRDPAAALATALAITQDAVERACNGALAELPVIDAVDAYCAAGEATRVVSSQRLKVHDIAKNFC